MYTEKKVYKRLLSTEAVFTFKGIIFDSYVIISINFKLDI